MSFYDVYNKYKNVDLDRLFDDVTDKDVEKALQVENLGVEQFISILSPKAENFLEPMAQRAHRETLQNFGKTIQLYTPMYLSDFCDSPCVYCGFNSSIKTERKKLEFHEVEQEARFIVSTGLKHVLILTGSSREKTPLPYLKECIKVLKKYFSSISIEIYALTLEEYGELIARGVDGLTIYQEVYDEGVYKKVHSSGEKKDYLFRLDAPERAAKKGMRTINIGVLFGLEEWKKEAFFLALHARYLHDKFGSSEISISVPRIRPIAGGFKPEHSVSNSDIVQIILAMRLFLPRVGITLSTREAPELRENILPLGVTRMSAGSTTTVGGHTLEYVEKSEQFTISDERSVEEIKRMLLARGYQPVLKDWVGT